jgi:hypothetical protein
MFNPNQCRRKILSSQRQNLALRLASSAALSLPGSAGKRGYHLVGKSAIPLWLLRWRRVSFLSTAEAAALDDVPACYLIGRPICSHKIEFSFLNGNLMVPAVGRYLNNLARMVRALNIVEGDEPWVLPASLSLRC